jgi:flagellar protein FliO/FliZ
MMDAELALRFVLALAVVLALIVATGWVGRRYMGAGRFAAFPGKRRRLAVVESLQVDGRTRLVLVRRDGAEHLVMVGGASSLVVESGIVAPSTFARAVDAANAGNEAPQ